METTTEQELRCVISDLMDQVRDAVAERDLIAKQRSELQELIAKEKKHAHLWVGSSCYTCGTTR